MFRFRDRFHLMEVAVKTFSAFVIFIALTVTVYTVGPWLETKYFPVVGKLEVHQIHRLDETTTRLFVSFRKLRNCQYLGISWFRGNPEHFERVPVVLMRAPGDISSPNRPIGHQAAGPWDVLMNEEDLRRNSFAELYHRCHFLWNTTTNFYP